MLHSLDTEYHIKWSLFSYIRIKIRPTFLLCTIRVAFYSIDTWMNNCSRLQINALKTEAIYYIANQQPHQIPSLPVHAIADCRAKIIFAHCTIETSILTQISIEIYISEAALFCIL